MDRHYQLKVTSDTTNINVDSVDADEIARIAQLAGIVQKEKEPTLGGVNPIVAPAAIPAVDPAFDAQPQAPDIAADQHKIDDFSVDTTSQFDDTACAICGDEGHDEHSCPQSISADSMDADAMSADMPTDLEDELAEEMAEFDIAYKNATGSGIELDQDDFIWQGTKLPQRTVKGNMGDNALISELHEHLRSEYQKYIEESARENEDGILSPLSDITKPEFDKDPFSDKTPDDDGSNSPMSTIIRQPMK